MLKMIVDLGCGTNKTSGAIGIDWVHYPGVNIVSDLEYSLPLRSNSIDALHASHILEHINNLIPLMEEIYRVCKPGALVYITVPYFTYEGAFRDPTHVRFFSEVTFSYFQDPTPYGIKTDFQIQDIFYKYRTIFRIFPKFIQKIFRRHLWNVVDEIKISLRVQKSLSKDGSIPQAFNIKNQ